MRVITRKSDIEQALTTCFKAYQAGNIETFVRSIHEHLLQAKIRFPLLEYCGEVIFCDLPHNEHLSFCDQLPVLKTIGGNVLIGIILQKRLPDQFNESFQKAAEYIDADHEWYVSDIIGERVYGYGLLKYPKQALPLLKKLSNHQSHMVVRAVGPGIHYATKKGLDKQWVEKAFRLLLEKANVKNHFEKKGLGWAAKTIAKFHPDIIENYLKQLNDKTNTGQWFRTKVRIGLERNAHSKN